jgi:hypothetical protein
MPVFCDIHMLGRSVNCLKPASARVTFERWLTDFMVGQAILVPYASLRNVGGVALAFVLRRVVSGKAGGVENGGSGVVIFRDVRHEFKVKGKAFAAGFATKWPGNVETGGGGAVSFRDVRLEFRVKNKAPAAGFAFR